MFWPSSHCSGDWIALSPQKLRLVQSLRQAPAAVSEFIVPLSQNSSPTKMPSPHSDSQKLRGAKKPASVSRKLESTV